MNRQSRLLRTTRNENKHNDKQTRASKGENEGKTKWTKRRARDAASARDLPPPISLPTPPPQESNSRTPYSKGCTVGGHPAGSWSDAGC